VKNNASRLGHVWLRVTLTILIILGVVAFWLLRPIRETAFTTPGFTPMRNDALALKYTPRFLPHPEYGAPTRIFYRMGQADSGQTHIAYHPFYADESNPHSGAGAMLSRMIYTGGYNLKNRMYGPADIELVEVIVQKTGQIKSVFYEDVKDYRPGAFSVTHLPITEINPSLPLCFEVKTWNHMVALRKPDHCTKIATLKAEYFSELLWNEYKMLKKHEAILRRNRAHKIYERVAAQ